MLARNVTTFAAVFCSVVSYKINYFRRARFVDMVGVTGSIPVAPTIFHETFQDLILTIPKRF